MSSPPNAPGPATGSSLPPADDAQIQAQVELARITAIHDTAGPPLLASFAFVAVMVAMLWPTAPHALLAGWVVWRLVLSAARLAAIAAFRREPHPLARRAHWTRVFVTLLVPDALGWAALPILFMPHVGEGGNAILFAAIIGIAAVGAFTNWHHRTAGLTFIATTLLPVAADQVLNRGDAGLYGGIAVCVYLALLSVEVVRAQLQLTETMRLRFGHARVAEQRREALALAEEASAAKTRFLAAASHEIRTPLNGVVGMAQLLRQTHQPALRARRLEVLHQSARHLQTVVDDLIDLGRLDLGRLDLRPEPMDPAGLAADVSDLLATLAANKGLRLELSCTPEVPSGVLADPVRVRQVLYNLLGNALKFTQEGHVKLTIAALPSGLRFTVSDTGPGIPPDSLERVFDAFEQAGPEAASRRTGAGLGLAISRELARAMGGDIRCQSTLGQGTVFEFDLFATPCEPPMTERTSPGLPDAPLQGHVLVADDNPVNALVAEGMLEQLGLSAEVVGDGVRALDRLTRPGIDLVLMDCLMPRMDGYEASRQQRERERLEGTPHMPIIALTANAVSGDREACLAAGMDDYLAKPFSVDELAAALRRQLPATSLRRPIAQPAASVRT